MKPFIFSIAADFSHSQWEGGRFWGWLEKFCVLGDFSLVIKNQSAIRGWRFWVRKSVCVGKTCWQLTPRGAFIYLQWSAVSTFAGANWLGVHATNLATHALLSPNKSLNSSGWRPQKRLIRWRVLPELLSSRFEKLKCTKGWMKRERERAERWDITERCKKMRRRGRKLKWTRGNCKKRNSEPWMLRKWAQGSRKRALAQGNLLLIQEWEHD